MPLRTYTAEIDGLNQWIVAAPNQSAALAAFGLHQNLFAQGLAGLTRDAELIEAANAQPGVPLKRPKSGGRFTSGPAEQDWSGALKETAKSSKGCRPPSRAKLDKARSDLDAVRAAGEKRLAKLEAAVLSAQERLEQARDGVEAQVAEAEQAVEAAHAAWREAH